MAKVKKIDHIAILTDNIEGALSFWRDGLGMELGGVSDVPAEKSLVAFLPIFFLAMTLAYLYEKTGSLWPSIALHMVNNTVATLFAILIRRAI